MARTRNQGERRRQIVAAAHRAVVKHGPAMVRLRDVADEAGLTSGAVLYYYDELETLLLEVHHRAVERFCRAREAEVDAADGAAAKLIAALRCGLPTGTDDELVRVLYEFEGPAFRNRTLGALHHAYFERQVGIYHSIIAAGAASGEFRLTAPARVIARNIVALEDGYGFYVVLEDSDIDRESAEQLILSYAETATGASLAASGRVEFDDSSLSTP
jgi:DNA-binding transcriptional regulator YbjK